MQSGNGTSRDSRRVPFSGQLASAGGWLRDDRIVDTRTAAHDSLQNFNATVRIPAAGFVNERQAMLDDFRSFGEKIIGKV